METISIKKLDSRHTIWLIPLAIFVVGLTVRVIGLKFSFPLLTHHDEIFIIDPLIEMSKNHTLDSGHYNKPTQILYTILFGYLNLLSKLVFHKNMGWAYEENVLFFYFHARMVAAIFGALIPVLAWRIGKAYEGFDFSLPAAFLMCFYPPYILHSHYIGVDISITFFTLSILLLCLVYLSRKKQVWLILASVMVAINTLEKYPGILSFGLILFTIAIEAFIYKKDDTYSRWSFILRRIGLSLGVVLLSMVVIAPHLFIKWAQIRDILILEGRSTHLGADNLSWAGNMLFYLREFIRQGGWLTSFFALIGLGYSITSKQPEMILLFYGVGYWVALSKLGLHWERWSLPMMISPLLLAGFGITRLWKAFSPRKLLRVLLTASFSILALLYVLNGLTSSVTLTWRDTRVDALQYLSEHKITLENSVSEGYTPYFSRTYKTVFDFDFDNPGQTRYVILSSNMFGRYAAEPERYLVENAFYTELREKATLIEEYVSDKKPTNPLDQSKIVIDYFQNLLQGTESNFRFGPVIQIYQLPQ